MRRGCPRQQRFIAGTLVGILAACGEEPAPAPPMATVGHEVISQPLFDAFVTERTGAPSTEADAALKQSLLTELKQLKAASLVGEKTVDVEFAQELELKRLEMLAKRAATAAGVYRPPTEVELQQAYRLFVDSLPASEYHVAHILVATENAAALLITKLQGGDDFAELARAESADASSANGGDLGWIAPGKLPTEFTDAVKALKSGAITEKPIHTIYGWHVIRLIETRPASTPPFEQVRAQLAANWQQDQYKRFLEESLSKSAATP